MGDAADDAERRADQEREEEGRSSPPGVGTTEAPPETPATPEEGSPAYLAEIQAAIDRLLREGKLRRPEEKPRGLYVKLAEVMAELHGIPAERLRLVTVETRTGGSYSYSYITEATLMEELRPKLAARGVAVLYSDTILRNPVEEDDTLTIVQVSLTFVDGETGERETLTSDGYGTDAGDKGANKAKTSALRYLLWKTFLFASPDDPETENVSRRSGARGGAAGGSPSSGAKATEKQQQMVVRCLNEAFEGGARDVDGREPDAAVHVRTPVPDMNKATASAMIDFLKSGAPVMDPETFSAKLDELLGPVRPDPESFPPDEDLMPGGGYGG